MLIVECRADKPYRSDDLILALHPDAASVPGTEKKLSSPYHEDYVLATFQCPHCGEQFSHEIEPLVPRKDNP